MALNIVKTENKIMAKDFLMKNWKRYELVDTADEFLALLNILSVYGECLDSLHDVCFNGRDECCCIYGRYDNDRDVAKTVLEYHYFMRSYDDVVEYLKGQMEANDTLEDIFELYKDDLTQTEDGYVLSYCC